MNGLYFPSGEDVSLSWHRHQQKNEDALAKKVFDTGVSDKRRRDRPCPRWSKELGETVTKIGI